MEACGRDLRITNDSAVIDVGGDVFYSDLVNVKPRLTILNIFDPPADLPAHVNWLIGDGCNMPYTDNEFDVASSNGVIEHLGSASRQVQFAKEVQRVGRSYFVQTPNRHFPIEPHLIARLYTIYRALGSGRCILKPVGNSFRSPPSRRWMHSSESYDCLMNVNSRACFQARPYVANAW